MNLVTNQSARYNDEKYADIMKQFPICMSKEDFYKVAHISKRTAEYLLKKVLVPCVYTGKKTRSYRIETKDVIQYLIRREIEPEIYAVPQEWRGQRILGPTLKDVLEKIEKYNDDAFRVFILNQLDAYDDLMSVKDVSEATGYSIKRITQLCRTGRIQTLYVRNKYHIPKTVLIDYLAEPKIYQRYTDVNDAPHLAREFLLLDSEHANKFEYIQ